MTIEILNPVIHDNVEYGRGKFSTETDVKKRVGLPYLPERVAQLFLALETTEAGRPVPVRRKGYAARVVIVLEEGATPGTITDRTPPHLAEAKAKAEAAQAAEEKKTAAKGK